MLHLWQVLQKSEDVSNRPLSDSDNELLAVQLSGYFSQEANASEPAPWHKESSGTIESFRGRVGVKEIESFRVFLFEGDGQWYSLSNRILCAVKAYVYHPPHAVATQHLLAVTHPPSRLGSIAAQQTPPQSARWMVFYAQPLQGIDSCQLLP